jgi:hypothetical protein
MIYGAKGIASKMRAQTFSETLHESLVNARKKHSPAFSLFPSPKCRDTENKENVFYSLSFLSVAGIALDIRGEGPAEGGEAGWSSIVASKLERGGKNISIRYG